MFEESTGALKNWIGEGFLVIIRLQKFSKGPTMVLLQEP